MRRNFNSRQEKVPKTPVFLILKITASSFFLPYQLYASVNFYLHKYLRNHSLVFLFNCHKGRCIFNIIYDLSLYFSVKLLTSWNPLSPDLEDYDIVLQHSNNYRNNSVLNFFQLQLIRHLRWRKRN